MIRVSRVSGICPGSPRCYGSRRGHLPRVNVNLTRGFVRCRRGGVDGEQMLRAALFVTPFLLLHQSCFASALILQGAAPRHPLTARAVVILAETDSERRERLRQLFGDDAGKIAERTAPKKKESKPVDVQMLIEGMQRLEWGAVRLVDVDPETMWTIRLKGMSAGSYGNFRRSSNPVGHVSSNQYVCALVSTE